MKTSLIYPLLEYLSASIQIFHIEKVVLSTFIIFLEEDGDWRGSESILKIKIEDHCLLPFSRCLNKAFLMEC